MADKGHLLTFASLGTCTGQDHPRPVLSLRSEQPRKLWQEGEEKNVLSLQASHSTGKKGRSNNWFTHSNSSFQPHIANKRVETRNDTTSGVLSTWKETSGRIKMHFFQ